MFDLERTITDWKSSFHAAESIDRENLDELEEHLRQAIAELTRNGLSTDEAFTIATKRLGRPMSLEQEYCKVNGQHVWQRRILWMLGGYLGGVAFSSLFSGLAALAGMTMSAFGYGGIGAGSTSVALAALAWSALLAYVYHSSKKRKSGTSHDRIPLTFSMSLLLMTGAGYVLKMAARVGHVRFAAMADYGQSTMLTSTGNIAIGAIVAVACVMMITVLSRQTEESTQQ